MQLRSGRRDQDPAKDRPPTPHFIVSVARGPEVSRVRSLTELCGLRVTVETYVAPKGPLQCKRCQRFGHTQRNCGHAPRCVACGGAHLSGECPVPGGQPKCCICGGGHTANYRGCVKWKEARAALAKRAPVQGPKSSTAGNSPAKKATQFKPSEEQMQLGEGWSHVVRGGRVVKATTPPPTPNPVPPLATQAQKPIATPTSNTAKPKKPAPKIPAAPKADLAQPSTELVGNPHPTPSPLEDISDLLDQLPFDACVELTRRLLTSISSLPSGAARERAVLKTVIFFVAEYGSTP
jgi:hypothetical protein